MALQLEIYVDGKGSSFRTAERGYLRLGISATSTDQSQAFGEVQKAAATVTNTFRALALKNLDNQPHPDAAVTAFSMTPLSTLSTYQRDKNYRELRTLPKEHTVNASAEAIFRNMDKLAEVSNQLATMPHISILGTEWRLTDATRAALEREARVKAIQEAVQKAEDYARVVGRQVVAVEIRDQPAPGSMPLHAAQAQAQYMMQQQAQSRHPSMSGIAVTAPEGPALEPKTITVSAAISAKFVSRDGNTSGMEETY
ncbi:hypothetical protein B0I37DRAFT_57754 [Chaetomium sp. MPI-CAGE-AT-0009]|nr:hypothetical protein B0I37DRAFT_57754 [Chaetomium sp. MPI-CAGE-AT-0009]